jgi:uncharacterized glyoxalase superfamily metalloenzyme YdcJ
MTEVVTWQLRARFAERLSQLYGSEVPAYNLLVDVCREINAERLEKEGASAERLGSIARVTAERHGAIRVGSPAELAQVARIFGALGMYPTGFYDLRDAYPNPIPVVSTAFRPVASEELARNPFRVFTSVLVPEDRRFFSADLGARVARFVAERRLFPEELLTLAGRAEAEGGLTEANAERFLDLAAASFALSPEPVDRAWYDELSAVSSVAADIGGVGSTHINHLTPRVLDIDELYRRMVDRGVEMIDEIQGPPRWSGPDVLLRQTSFRALAEPRRFREADGTLTVGSLRVRFGEVEARGIALTAAGRARYEQLDVETARRLQSDPALSRQEVAAEVWSAGFPRSEAELVAQDLAFFSYVAVTDRPGDGKAPPSGTSELLSEGWLRAEPVVYEDFLPRSAAGIFSSNLTAVGSVDAQAGAAERDGAWMSEMLGRPVLDPDTLYRGQSLASLRAARARLGRV